MLCQGAQEHNTKEVIECTLHKGAKKDTVMLKDPLSTDGADVADGIYVGVGIGQTVSFQIRFITNPLSTAPVEGFEIKTLDRRGGTIASGIGEFQVLQPVEIASISPEIVNLIVTETLIYEESDFLLEVQMPVPLEEGCKIELAIPEPLEIGRELTTVEVGGQFGPVKEAYITIDKTRNMI